MIAMKGWFLPHLQQPGKSNYRAVWAIVEYDSDHYAVTCARPLLRQIDSLQSALKTRASLAETTERYAYSLLSHLYCAVIP